MGGTYGYGSAGEEDECHYRDCFHGLTVFLQEGAVALDYEVECLWVCVSPKHRGSFLHFPARSNFSRGKDLKSADGGI